MVNTMFDHFADVHRMALSVHICREAARPVPGNLRDSFEHERVRVSHHTEGLKER